LSSFWAPTPFSSQLAEREEKLEKDKEEGAVKTEVEKTLETNNLKAKKRRSL
jgi:hypothetical protein